jgi:hypothetical protein
MLASNRKSRRIVSASVAVITLGIVVSSVLRVQGQAAPTRTLRFVDICCAAGLRASRGRGSVAGGVGLITGVPLSSTAL